MTKCLICFFAILFLIGCSKSKEARALEDQLNNTRWELYLIEDSLGNDITAQVMEDSLICECFEFKEYNSKSRAFNAVLSKCNNTFFDSYKGYWTVSDWWRKERKEGKGRDDFSNGWKDFGVSIGNVGLESTVHYLGQFDFVISDDGEVISQPRFYQENGWYTTDILMETRFYRKVD